MKQSKFLGMSLLCVLMVGTTFHAQINDDATFLRVSAQNEEIRNAKQVTEDKPNYPKEAELLRFGDNLFCADINKSAVMDDFQSVEMTLYNTISTFKGPRADCFVGVTDYGSHEAQTGPNAIHYNEYEDEDADNYYKKIPHVSGSLLEIRVPNSVKGSVIVPQSIQYTDRFVVDVVNIGSDVFNSNSRIDRLKNVYIPATIESIAEGAFDFPKDKDGEVVVNNDIHVYCERSKDAVPYVEGFLPESLRKNVEYGYKFTKEQTKELNPLHSSALKPIEGKSNFLVGVKDTKTGEVDGAKLNYKVKTKDNKVEDRKIALEMGEKTTVSTDGKHKFEILGKRGIAKLVYNIDIPLVSGEEIIDDSFKLTNIYEFLEVDKDTKTPIYDKDAPKWAEARLAYGRKERFSDFVEDYYYEGVSTFGDYTSIRFVMNFTDEEYKQTKSAVYENSLPKIKTGEYFIRTRIINADRLRYDFTYVNDKNELKHEVVKIPLDIYRFTIGAERGEINILFKNSDVAPDFNGKNIRSFAMKNVYLYKDIYIPKTGNFVVGSDTYTRFAHINVIPNGATPETFSYNHSSLDAIIGWTMISALILYILGSVGLFFYRKVKYKNDEFRRVKPMLYLKNSIYGLLGLMVVLADILFISLRWTLLNNSIIVANPLDAYVIAFTVIGGVILGYGIKVLVANIKLNAERRRNVKLKIDEDVVDDGTN